MELRSTWDRLRVVPYFSQDQSLVHLRKLLSLALEYSPTRLTLRISGLAIDHTWEERETIFFLACWINCMFARQEKRGTTYMYFSVWDTFRIFCCTSSGKFLALPSAGCSSHSITCILRLCSYCFTSNAQSITYSTFSSGKCVYSGIWAAISAPSEHTHSSESTSSRLLETNCSRKKNKT